LALGSIAGPAGYALARPGEALQAISASIATDRTYTKYGLDLMKERGFDQPWREAISAIAARLG
jgi:pyrroline-5-carboxylate reductase